MIQLTIKHKEVKTTIEAANKIADYLQLNIVVGLLERTSPIISKINNYYLRDILIKIPRNYKELNRIKQDIQQAINGLYQFQSFKQIRVVVDVDVY